MSDFRTAPEFASARRHWVTSKVFEAEGFEDEVVISMVCRRIAEPQLDRQLRRLRGEGVRHEGAGTSGLGHAALLDLRAVGLDDRRATDEDVEAATAALLVEEQGELVALARL